MDTKKRKRLPYGMSNFETLITENFVYVDKTRYIELLENESNGNLFFTRPRKFGKSLFLSMLSHYYDVNGAEKFDALFGNLYIGKHPTPKRNSYLVLNLDFSGIDTTSEDGFIVSFSGKIESGVRMLLAVHERFMPNAEEMRQRLLDNESKVGVRALEMLLDEAAKIGIKIFVIIDEYDHFANDLIAMGSSPGDDFYRSMIRANGIVRDFYETLKTGTKTVIERILLTGITPIMLDDMTSGFNIANNISLKGKYNEILGFTQEEVNQLMEETGIDKSLIKVDMELFYNGYLFHKYGEHRVYNSSMMLYFFNELLETNLPAEHIIDENLKTDYGRLKRLIQTEPNRKQLMEIAQNGRIPADVMLKFSISQLQDNQCFVSLLFYMGLLTIDNSDRMRMQLKIPNYSIRTVYWGYIEGLTRDRNEDVQVDISRLTESMYRLAKEDNPQPFIDYISQNIVSRLSNRDLIQFDEKYLKIILLNNLFYNQYFIPLTEMEVTQGYTDIYLQRSHLFPDIASEWVWEVKYIKKSDENNAALVREKRDDACVQLEKYRASHFFAERTDVRYLSVIFIGKDKVKIEEVFND